MAERVINDKGFLIIKTTREEILSAHPLNLGVCDGCNFENECDIGYYIACLNRWYCTKCYNNWYAKAERYPEDINYEIGKFTAHCDCFGIEEEFCRALTLNPK